MYYNIPEGFGLRKEAKKVTIDTPTNETSYKYVGAKDGAGAVESVSELIFPSLPYPLAIPTKIMTGDQGGLGSIAAHIIHDGTNKSGLDKVSPIALLPGAGSYRNAMRDMYVDRKLSKGKNVHRSALAEMLGQRTSGILPTLIGLGLGSVIVSAASGDRDKNIVKGALAGGGSMLGLSLLANLIGRLAGTAKKRRTDKEHSEYLLNDNVMAKYLVPGIASYHRGRRAKMAGNPLV